MDTFKAPDGSVYKVEGKYASGTPFAHDELGGLVTPDYAYFAFILTASDAELVFFKNSSDMPECRARAACELFRRQDAR